MFYRRKKANKAALLPSSEDSTQPATTSMDKSALSTSQADSSSGVPGITVDKSVEFSYEELFNATEGFSMSNKIGQGGFGAVYYAELRGEKAAIKKMDMQASHEFLAELKVLTHVHHLNLVSDFFLFTAMAYLICDFPLRFLYFLTYKSNRHTFMFVVHVTLMYTAI